VRDTLADEEGGLSAGLEAEEGGQLEVTDSLVTGNAVAGPAALGSSSRLDVANTVVTGTEVGIDGNYGLGILASAGAELNAREVAVRGNAWAGIAVLDEARATLERMIITGNHGAGSFVFGNGAQLELDDSTVANTQQADISGRDEGLTVGLEAGEGATGLLTRSFFEDNPAGLAITDEGTWITVDGSAVVDTRETPGSDDVLAFGIIVARGAALEATACLVGEAKGMGLFAYGALTSAQLTGSIARSTRPAGGAEWQMGVGLTAGLGADLAILRSLVAANAGAGLLFSGQGKGVVESSAFLDTSTCFASEGWVGNAKEVAFGDGIAVTEGGTLDIIAHVMRISRTS